MSNPTIHPQFRSKIVCTLACRHCNNIVSLRGMKAILLGDTKVELYSTDASPTTVALVDNDYMTKNCQCKIRDVACLGCGNVCGYHVTKPCSNCLEACNNGHFWMFHSDSVEAKEMFDQASNRYLLWAQLTGTKELEFCAYHKRDSICRKFIPSIPTIGFFRLLGSRANHAFKLRPYQQECIQATVDKFKSGIKRQAVCLPVGSGKTVVFCNLINTLPGNGKVLILAHRDELLQQAFNQCMKHSPNLKIELDQGRKSPDFDADVIIGSVATLGRAGSNRLDIYDPEKFKCIIIDEAHHAAASSYRRIIDHFGICNPTSKILLWGCSATLRRFDGLNLGEIFEEIVYSKGILEMIHEKWICDVDAHRIKTQVSLEKISTKNGDYKINDLSRAINIEARNQSIVHMYQLKALSTNRKSTLVFAVDVKHIEDLVETFRNAGIDARGVHGKTKAIERQKILDDFRNQKFPVLINCGILTEGTDIPCIDCIILGRPTRSPVLLQQMLGRGLRLYSKKENCLVLDFEDLMGKNDIYRAGIPTLLGRYNTESPDSSNSSKQNATFENNLEAEKSRIKIDAKSAIENVAIKVTLKQHIAPFAHNSEIDIYGNSICPHEFVWTKINNDHFTISLEKFKSITISKGKSGIYHIKEIYGTETSDLFTHDCLGSAIGAAEAYIIKKIGYSKSRKLSRFANWRSEWPSEAQIKLLKKWNLNSELLTKGEACSILAKKMSRFRSMFKKSNKVLK